MPLDLEIHVVESSATLKGVTLAIANSAAFKTAFKAGIAEQYAVLSSDVTIGTIVEGRRRLSGGVTIPFTITTTSASSAAGFKDVTVNTANIQTKILADYSGAENLSEMTVESVEDVQDVETNPILSTAASRAPMHSSRRLSPSFFLSGSKWLYIHGRNQESKAWRICEPQAIDASRLRLQNAPRHGTQTIRERSTCICFPSQYTIKLLFPKKK